jgi:chloramphenicol 3-O phosphotransferase
MHVIERGPFAERMLGLFEQLALTTINNGFPIIIDDVAERGAPDVARWRAALQGYNVLWIGLTAPLEVLEARERTRSNRAPGMSRAQFKVVHKGVDYDLFFDTDATSTDTIADIIRIAIEQANGKNLVASL